MAPAQNEKEACDIYIGMNTLKLEARTRTKGTFRPSAIFTWTSITMARRPWRRFAIQLVPPPNYTLNTSPEKFQIVWRVEGIDGNTARPCCVPWHAKLGGDPAATDSTRVLRLPGFVNRKYQTEFRVQAEKHTDRIHHLQDFRLRTEPIDNDFRAHYRLLTQRSSETRPLSQSEHDWIFAKRALARGDDPEKSSAGSRIFAAVRKATRRTTPRLTVSKAQQHLATEKATPTQADGMALTDQSSAFIRFV